MKFPEIIQGRKKFFFVRLGIGQKIGVKTYGEDESIN